MNILRSVLVLFFLIFKTIDDVEGDCTLSLTDNEFGSPAPVYLRNDAYVKPDATTGAISLRRSETLQIACPGKNKHIVLNNASTSYSVLEAHCIINTTFRVDRWIGQFQDIKCNSPPTYTVKDTKNSCHSRSRIYRVGYEIKNKLYKLYDACFDKDVLTTQYVKHELVPSSRYKQLGFIRPRFTEGNLFGKVRMSTLYNIENQKKRIDSSVGVNTSNKYISKKEFLSRGHLAARADFTLSAEMRATFHYVNTAPQWMGSNAGDWAALEHALRSRMQSLNNGVTVYTGTHGVMTLPDKNGKQHHLYLYTDENNNGAVPVPMYFYKLVHDPKNKTAVAFLSINSSFYNRSMMKDLEFCDDICDGNSKYSWLKWRSDSTHSFCCNYEEFTKEINYLDKLDVRGLFY